MSKKVGRNRRKRIPSPAKPISWDGLDKLGLARDHFYRRFLEINLCPNCEWESFGIRWVTVGVCRGWEWRCERCGQVWREPQVTPRKRSLLPMVTE